MAGKAWSDERKAEHSARMKAHWEDPQRREEHAAAMRDRVMTPDEKSARSKAKAAWWAESPDIAQTRAKMSLAKMGHPVSFATRRKSSLRQLLNRGKPRQQPDWRTQYGYDRLPGGRATTDAQVLLDARRSLQALTPLTPERIREIVLAAAASQDQEEARLADERAKRARSPETSEGRLLRLKAETSLARLPKPRSLTSILDEVL